jgi:hypothetical protein
VGNRNTRFPSFSDSMTVHSLHIFDRRGKTLFTKNYSPISQQIPANVDDEEEYLAEKRKLIFGMLFSLRELTGSLGPEGVVPGECGGTNEERSIYSKTMWSLKPLLSL